MSGGTHAALPHRPVVSGMGGVIRRLSGSQITSLLCLGLGYYVSGYYGIVAKMPPAGIAAVWPPVAVLLAALLLTPRSRWWQLVAIVVPVHVVLFVQCMPEMSAATMVSQLVGYVGQSLVAAELLRRVDGIHRLDTLRRVTWFVVVGALATPAISSLVIVYAYTLTGWVTDFWAVWRQRLLSNMVALLTLTPLIVVTVNGGAATIRRARLGRYLEFAAVILLMCAVVAAVFGWETAGSKSTPALLYALLPLLLWAAVRLEPAGLYSCLVLIVFGCLFGAYHGRGPFFTLSSPENVFAMQLFLIALSLPMMLLTAVLQERSRAADALRDSQTRYVMATLAGSSGVWEWNLRTGDLYLDPGLKAMLGFHDDEIANTMAAWTEHTHPDDRAHVARATEPCLSGLQDTFEVEHRAIHKDGSVRWLLCRGVIAERIGDEVVRVVGTDTEITRSKTAERMLRRSHERVREMAGQLMAAQEEERRRIARDLHDDLNQQVAALSIELSKVRSLIPSSSKRLSHELERLQSHTAQLVHKIRDLSHDIHPSTLEHGGLESALTALAAELSRLEDFELKLALRGQTEQLPPRVSIAVYRIAQEAIRNVLRHADTRRAEIRLSVDGGELTLLISDQGRGFDPAVVSENGGLGLISIEERVRLLDGRFQLSSQNGRGTVLRVDVPVTQSVVA